MLHLGSTVGRTATNHPSDVRVIQQLLNRFRPLPLSLLRVDGNIDVHAVAAIEHFQRTVMKMTTPDGGGAARKVDQYAAQKVIHSEGGSFYVLLI